MTRKVFVVTDGGHDYSDAQRFGEVHFCIKDAVRKDDVAQMYREIKSCLDEHAQAGDYILVGSLTTMCMITSALMADKFGELHLLLWVGNQYVEKSLILPSCQVGGDNDDS